MIKSISYSDQDIIKNILLLHGNGGNIDLDPTYSTGVFYKGEISRPKYIYDIKPQVDGCEKASADNIPLPDESVNIIMFDPPFVLGGVVWDRIKENSCLTARRFSHFHTFNDLKVMYKSSLSEFYRLLRPKGIVIFKCQDTVSSAKQHFTHVWVMNEALKAGFYPLDLFIKASKSRLLSGKVKQQQHARKYHSYFWVFKKTNNKVNYD